MRLIPIYMVLVRTAEVFKASIPEPLYKQSHLLQSPRLDWEEFPLEETHTTVENDRPLVEPQKRDAQRNCG